jgi:orotate phosphoribosyltransferase
VSIIKAKGDLRAKLLDLIKETKAYFPVTSLGEVFPVVQGTSYLFDMDRLWSTPDSLSKSAKLVIKAAEQAKVNYAMVGGLTSRTGMFGTIPICSVISLESTVPLIVFEEERFSRFNAHPNYSPQENPVKGKNILLVKDVILRGDALEKAMDSIAKLGGKLSGIVVLVDLGIGGLERYSAIPNDVPIVVIAEGPGFSELESQ